MKGKHRPEGFIGVSMGKSRQGRVNSSVLTGANNFGGSRGTGTILSCLVPGPRMI